MKFKIVAAILFTILLIAMMAVFGIDSGQSTQQPSQQQGSSSPF